MIILVKSGTLYRTRRAGTAFRPGMPTDRNTGDLNHNSAVLTTPFTPGADRNADAGISLLLFRLFSAGTAVEPAQRRRAANMGWKIQVRLA